VTGDDAGGARDGTAHPHPVRRGSGVTVTVGIAVALIFAAVVAVAMLRSDDPVRTYSYVIPAGAAEMAEADQVALGGPPSSLELRVGDTIEVRNADSITHTYSFLVLAPGETGRYTFTTVGSFSGECTFVAHETVSIIVDG
jgi:plastocyanin